MEKREKEKEMIRSSTDDQEKKFLAVRVETSAPGVLNSNANRSQPSSINT